MAIIPLPVHTDSPFNNKVFFIVSTDYLDPQGANTAADGSAGSGTVETPYFASDMFLAIMLFRFFFIFQALMMFIPTNKKLYGKRICQDFNFEPTFTF